MSKRAISLALFLLSADLFAQTASQPATDPWKAMQALVGEWVGEGGGQPGQASSGGFSFASGLQGAVLIRRNFAEYPAAKDRPALRHEDLTIISRPASAAPPHAAYYDSEGHVIDYAVSASNGGSRIEWVSAPQPDQPRYRFTYILTSPDALKLLFEIAPPGKPDEFKLYIEASARRAAKHS